MLINKISSMPGHHLPPAQKDPVLLCPSPFGIRTSASMKQLSHHEASSVGMDTSSSASFFITKPCKIQA